MATSTFTATMPSTIRLTTSTTSTKEVIAEARTYYIARVARTKLRNEANHNDHDLRRICAHANLYDFLLDELAVYKRQQYLQKGVCTSIPKSSPELVPTLPMPKSPKRAKAKLHRYTEASPPPRPNGSKLAQETTFPCVEERKTLVAIDEIDDEDSDSDSDTSDSGSEHGVLEFSEAGSKPTASNVTTIENIADVVSAL
ncbi:hypothetical protein K490DRAFT_69914 [Saccharata proteae CBS 121410]|uniref:Uncharacterized protein n=1 Tax=Saccharata proteae CBS 121410 TaxID=1314787 RepID=A0A9P4LR98_9PEZI|nr:hypothetical protein K490DRAFT_69914 [Saccharata proteae CBS 121410]